MPKCVLTEGWCLCGCHHLWNWLECPYGCLSLHSWKLGVMQVPIGKEREVWKLKYQVVQNYINPSKRNFQKEHSLLLQIKSKKQEETKNMAHVKHIKWRLVLDMIWCQNAADKGLALPIQLHRSVQSPKLGNHWLVLMIVEVGALVSNLPNWRRV